VIAVLAAGLAVGFGVTDLRQEGENQLQKNTSEQTGVYTDPEISGWVAWWKEAEAYELVASNSAKIRTISPVWWQVSSDMLLEKIGKSDRAAVTAEMRAVGVKIYPTLGSELTGKKLSPLFDPGDRADQIIAAVTAEAAELKVDGLDVDLEGIEAEDRERFTDFLIRLKSVMQAAGLKLSVTIQAQDGKNFWFGAAGQDIAKIAEIADEVRIMAYDRHSKSSGPGPVAPADWIADVAEYNLKLIPREKIVMGIPSYGYIWPKTGTAEGLQWDEFWKRIEGKNYSSQRDTQSGELYFSGEDFSGWLCDAAAMKTKIDLYRKKGLNRFVIWHLGGLDAEIFDTVWRKN
jgi:hypothetical protein